MSDEFRIFPAREDEDEEFMHVPVPAPPAKVKPGRKTKAELDAREAELAAREAEFDARASRAQTQAVVVAAAAALWQPPGPDPATRDRLQEVQAKFSGLQVLVQFGWDSTGSMRVHAPDAQRGGAAFTQDIGGSAVAKRCVTVAVSDFWEEYTVRSVARGEFRMPELDYRSPTLLGPLMDGLAATTLAYEQHVAAAGGYVMPGAALVLSDFRFHDFGKAGPRLRAWREWMEGHDQIVVAIPFGQADADAAEAVTGEGLVLPLVGEQVVSVFRSLAESIADSLNGRPLKDLLKAAIKGLA
ncbi:MAG: hypothetical protein K2X87_14840 [Gemmataceae bacterium]|nr:hypothetical protein [Gemmataceae bacterium]